MAERLSEQTREIPALSMRAAFRPETANDEKRTIELVWTTGARVKRGFWEPFLEELSLDKKHVRMERLNSGRAPLLDNHRSYGSAASIPGVIESARLKGKEGVCVVRFAKAEDDEEAEKLYRKAKDGIVTNVSVGYIVHKYERVQEGEEQKGALPVYRAVDWEPYEVSFVPIGADAGAFARSAPELHTCTFVTRSTGEHMETENTPSTPAPAAAAPAAPASATPPVTSDEARRAAEEATRIERERGNAIRTAVRAAKLGDAYANELIEKGIAIGEARAMILEKLASASDAVRTDPHHRVEVTDDARDKFARGAQAWLLTKTGAAELVRRAGEKMPVLAGVELSPGEFRGMSIVDLAREFLELRGQDTKRKSAERLIGEALTFRTGGYQTTSDFSVLLENVMHKTLLAAYATTPDSWSRFCAVGSVTDFRAHNRYRTGSFGRLDKLTEAGEFKNKVIPDGEKVSVSISTRGNIIAISRQALINDDMGALTGLATRFGRAAKLSIELDVYDLIKLNAGLGPTQSDGQPLFHANRANVGAAAAIAVDALDSDRIVMAVQKDPSGNEILDLRPAILLVPIGLGGQARVLNDSQYDASVSNKFQVPNKVRGLFRDIVDTPQLTGTRRYLLADPSVAPTFEVDFLNGQTEPFLDNNEGWRVDGTELKVRHDYGVAAVDFRGAVTNAGA